MSMPSGGASKGSAAGATVLVVVSGPDPKHVKAAHTPSSTTTDGTTSLSSSGLQLGGGYVVTAVTALYPLLSAHSRSQLSAAPAAAALLPAARIKCQVEGSQTHAAKLVALVQVPAVMDALGALLAAPSVAQWQLGWSSALPTPASLAIASHLAVLQLQAAPHTPQAVELPNPGLGVPPPGALLTAWGCPFGAAAALPFLQYSSAGVLAGYVHPPALQHRSAAEGASSQPALLLADVRCLPGMEGGPVVESSGGALVGLLAPPLVSPHTHAQLSIVLPAAAVLEAVRSALPPHGGGFDSLVDSAPLPRLRGCSIVGDGGKRALLLGSVVAVTCDGAWASGVVCTPQGHVLTNAHAVAAAGRGSATQVRVQTRCSDANRTQWHAADVVHCFKHPLDLAVLRITFDPGSASSSPPPPHASLASSAPVEGAQVLVAGFPLFRPGAGGIQGPLLTAGNVAKVVHLATNGTADATPPAMLITSAAVHAGGSGGGVFDPGTGALLGLVTSNARRSPSAGSPRAALYPHLNFSIPAALLAPVVDALLAGGAVDWAAVEAAYDGEGLRGVWALHGAVQSGEGGEQPPAAPGPRLPEGLAAMLQQHVPVGRPRL